MKKRHSMDNLVKGIIYLSSIVTVGVLLWILIYVVSNGIGEISWDFISQTQMGEGEEGILPYIVSTLYVILITIIIATPIGIFSAIYLVEYAKPGKVVRVIRFATESLAGIPSIVFGLYGLIFFVTFLNFGWSILSGSLTLSMMVLPTIVRTTEESLKAVPNTFREGSLGLGASKLRTIRKVILPSAIPGILTGVILSIGRIVGETAAIYLTLGTVKWMPKGLMDGGRTLAVHLYYLAKEGISFEKAYATATILILIVLVINFIANKLASRLNKAKQ
ncbi:phosphate ABC transporter permease PstA [Sporosalibacterium faouarense]|uniref:phosphate ABC transporter permease PstA n=1 Tax=Sporosalibacterium faouarense TaxID=516123 RepID=UPI00141C5609|nr:phosphate ABC transporter permease PstA [Sporosalibacterium faouarense]MTI49061.1 phosphate ABC transporter permease PstA [Bacillota bacterium]